MQIFIGIMTTIIAGLVAFITFLQWRTNHHRVVLDTFDKRWRVIEGTTATIAPIMRAGQPTGLGELIAFDQATVNARFLFGDDVNDYLKQIRKRIIDLGLCRDMLESLEVGEERSKWVRRKSEALLKVADFYVEFPKLCEPYVKLDHKRVRTPAQWFRDRNTKRLSYGDFPSEQRHRPSDLAE